MLGEGSYLLLDDCGYWEVMEGLSEELPHICAAILPQTLIVESVGLCDLSTLMITAQQCDSTRKADLQRKEER